MNYVTERIRQDVRGVWQGLFACGYDLHFDRYTTTLPIEEFFGIISSVISYKSCVMISTMMIPHGAVHLYRSIGLCSLEVQFGENQEC